MEGEIMMYRLVRVWIFTASMRPPRDGGGDGDYAKSLDDIMALQ